MLRSHQFRRATLGSVLALLALAACDHSGSESNKISQECRASGESDGPGAGIINGKTLTSTSRLARGTVMVVTKMQDGTYDSCSASLIAPDLVLTAAHCVRTGDSSEAEKIRSTRVAFTPVADCAASQTNGKLIPQTVRKIVSHPNYQTTPNGQSDLALIFLNEAAPSGTSPLPITFSEPDIKTDEPVYIAGFGRQNDLNEKDTSDFKLRYTSLHRISDAETPSGTGHLLILRSDEGSAGCSGDSGGPAMLLRDGVLSVVGVASYVYDVNQRTHTCLSRIAYTKTSAFRDWIVNSSEGRLPID